MQWRREISRRHIDAPPQALEAIKIDAGEHHTPPSNQNHQWIMQLRHENELINTNLSTNVLIVQALSRTATAREKEILSHSVRNLPQQV
eukprot:2783035-Amphidinium_carterae.1